MKIVHDIHTHNVFSHCCSDYGATTEAYIAKEQEIGNRVFGLSNHIWDERVKGSSSWYRQQTISLAEEAKAAVKKERDGIRCLFGAESEYFGCDDIVGMSVDGAKHFDLSQPPCFTNSSYCEILV
jgi:histidinol phosphatase-like PHP family hydrolase